MDRGIIAKYDSLDEIAAGIGEMDEIDKVAGEKLLRRYQDILADIEKLPDSEQKTYYLDFHQEIIADLEDLFQQLHFDKKTGNSTRLLPVLLCDFSPSRP